MRNGNSEFGKAAIVAGTGVGFSTVTARLFADDGANVPFNDTPTDFCTGTCLLIGRRMAI
ncbi:MAG: hypothetical protein ACFFAY_06250 [Promethearchaeota archaeon]